MHLADHLPDRPGLEVFDVHEEKGTYAWDLHDAKTGQVLLKGGPAGVTTAADWRHSMMPTSAAATSVRQPT